MKLKLKFSFLSSVMLFNWAVYAQNNILHVDQSTGTASVAIPLYTINAAHISLPISLVYNATGIKVNDVEGTAGVGWNLNAGGAITRQVRGLPDDITTDDAGDDISGWMSIDASTINNFQFANLGPSSTCKDETADLNYIESNFYNRNGIPEDTEPDIFLVNVPGLTCQLIFDNINQKFTTVPYQDVKISYTYSSTFGITSFTIINDEGITYTFGALETSYQRATNPDVAPAYFSTGHSQYAGGITYYSAWNLTSISDIYNNSINISYIAGTKKGYNNPIQVYGATTATTLYNFIGNTTPNLVSQISCSDGVNTLSGFNFTYNTNTTTQKSYISTISGLGRNFQFSYSSIISGKNNFNRSYLNSVYDGDCNTPFYYSFAYIGPEILPDSTSTSIDYYGYYNGASNISLVPTIEINPSTPGYDRYRNWQFLDGSVYTVEIFGNDRQPTIDCTLGTLTTINYADGGNTTISYENNDYYDNVLGENVAGAGLRVMQVQDNDGSKTITKNYSYIDPSTGYSSGQPVSLPIFAFTTGYSGNSTNPCNSCILGPNADQWDFSTIRSASDLSTDDHTVYYSSVKETQSGAGYTVYQYDNPATYNSPYISTPLPWSQTIVNVGRQNIGSSCPSIGLLVNDKNTYPFPPNVNFDFERGLLSSITNYNESSIKVSQVNYAYLTPQTPNIITALKNDFNGIGTSASALNYSKYVIYTEAGPLITKITKQVFDLTPLTAVPLNIGEQTTTSYIYNGMLHKKPTKILVQNSDGTLQTTNMAYIKDYVIPSNTSAADNFTLAIQYLQHANVNNLVEKYFQITPPGTGSSTITTGGELTKYNIFPKPFNDETLPIQKLKFVATNGTPATFQRSSINSSAQFINDPNYNIVANYLAYDNSGNLLSNDDGFKNITTSLIDHYTAQTAAIVSGALYNEIATDDFDSNLSSGHFSVSSSGPDAAQTISYSAPGRSGAGSLTFGQGVQLSSSVQKNPIATNYILTIWVKSTANGQIDVNLSGQGVVNATIPYTITTVPNTSTGWRFCKVIIPVTSITSSSFNVTLSLDAASTQNINVDDILFYPDIAEINTFAYNPVTHYKIAETNMNGVSNYYNVDQFGRINYVYDQDKNITLRKTYTSLFNDNILAATIPTFTYTVSNNVYTFTNTSILSPCSADPTAVRWLFPNGFVMSYGNQPVTYTNSAGKSFQVCVWLDYNPSNPTGGKCLTINP